MNISKLLKFLSTTALVVGFSTLAHAQATRTWVSGVGDDANPCSRTAPCKTFAGAISKTAAQGEINVLDPGGFGAVTITKSITIRSDHVEAGVLVSANNGINVNAGVNDQITLEGLDIEGLGLGTNGVNVIGGLVVNINRCTIHHFPGKGVASATTNAGTRVFVKDSNITENGGGVNIAGNGVGNAGAVTDCFIDGNTSFAVQANGVGSSIAIMRSILSNSPTAVGLLNSATSVSFGPSCVTTGTTTITTTLPFK
jgi:hypothetical protein